LVPRPKPPEPSIQTNVRLPVSLAAALDAEVEAYRAEHPMRVYTRSDLIREIVHAHLNRRGSVVGSKPGQNKDAPERRR
jgi:hypothetical protein